MATQWRASLTPYHKKEGLSYLIGKLERYAKKLNKQGVALAVESIANQIADDTAQTYSSAQYDGRVDVRVSHYTSPSGGSMPRSDKEVVVEARPVSGQVNIVGKHHFTYQRITGYSHRIGYDVLQADVYTTWCVEVKGQLGSFLEFGTGDKYRETGYSYRFASTYIRSLTAKHFVGENGQDTWVYKGEQGKNPATLHNTVHNSKGQPREGYYYSQGNYPTRGLYNAVRKFKRSPSNVRNVLSRAYYEFMKTIY